MEGYKLWVKECGKMDTSKNKVYFVMAIAMLVYAVPRLQIGQGWTLPTIFSIVWLFFALIIIAAHLHSIFKVEKDEEEALNQIKQMRRLQMQRLLQNRSKTS
jgi:hypothetical protein